MGLATGQFNANAGNPAELNVRSFAKQILRRFPNGSAPMFALSSMSGKSSAKSSTHGYFSKTMAFIIITMAATALAGDATLTVPSTAGIVPGMLLSNQRTNEMVRVTTVTSGTVLAVRRAFGRIAAAAVNVGDKWVQAGTAFEEGSDRPTARRLSTEYIPNYTQIFRNAWALTGTARASYAEMGISNIAENKSDCAMFHSVDIESAILFGQPIMDTSGATPIHATQGVMDALRQYAPGNVNVAGSTTTYDQLVSLVEPGFLYSTNLGDAKSRVAFCDSTALKVINGIGRKSAQVTMENTATQFGMRYTNFTFYKGTIDLVEHPLLNGLGQAGVALVMDMPALKMAYMDGRDTVPEEYGSTSGADRDLSGRDADGGSLTTELAVELVNPYSCTLITGLTAAA